MMITESERYLLVKILRDIDRTREKEATSLKLKTETQFTIPELVLLPNLLRRLEIERCNTN